MNFDLISLILSIVWLCFIFFFVVLKNFLVIILLFQEIITKIVDNKKEIMYGISVPLTIVAIAIVVNNITNFSVFYIIFSIAVFVCSLILIIVSMRMN